MQPVFADTFYWIALLNPDDRDHQRVAAFDLEPRRPPLVTSEEVLTEFLTYFSGRGELFRRKAAMVAYTLLEDPDVHVLPQTSEGFAAGLHLYADRLDKAYSLTDCISMQIMRHQGLRDALTADRHFEQEGFRPLFRAARSPQFPDS